MEEETKTGSSAAPGPREAMLDLEELGRRLGMEPATADLAYLERHGHRADVVEGLVHIVDELERGGASEAKIADVLEKLGEYQVVLAHAETSVDARGATASWERCLEVRSRCLGRSHPDTVWIRHILAMWYANSGMDAQALALTEESLQYGATGVVAGRQAQQLSLLASLLARLGRVSESLHQWDRLVESIAAENSVPPIEAVAARASRAMAYAQAGRFGEVRSEYEWAIRQFEAHLPESAERLARVAWSYSVDLGKAGNLEEAELAHQLHVVVALRHGMIPMDRQHERPTQDQRLAIEAIWSRFPPRVDATAERPARLGDSPTGGSFRRLIERIRRLLTGRTRHGEH